MEHLGPHPQRLAEAVRLHRHDHAFLKIQPVVRMRAAIDDIHHRYRHGLGVRSANIAIQRQAETVGRSMRRGQRCAEDGVGAELALVLGSIERQHHPVDRHLVYRVHAGNGIRDGAIDGLDCLQHTLAAETRLVSITQLYRLIFAGRRPGRHGGTPHAAIGQEYVRLHGGIATAVKNLAADDL